MLENFEDPFSFPFFNNKCLFNIFAEKSIKNTGLGQQLLVLTFFEIFFFPEIAPNFCRLLTQKI